MNDRFIETVVKNCKSGKHQFSEWAKAGDVHERHCVYCEFVETISEGEIYKEIDSWEKDEFNKPFIYKKK